MLWESLGFKENPFSTDPITQKTLQLYTGHANEVSACSNVLNEKKVITVIEGARGVGTTSFANYLRFLAQEKGYYFTPRNEIRVGEKWTLETLLAVVITNIVREIELFQSDKVLKDKRFKDAKALSIRIAEAYRSFGISAFGFGVNYGKSAGISSQPVIVPSSVLGHHLEDLAMLIKKSLNYKYGLLVQLNNLDIGAIHDDGHIRYLFNAMRDYFQTEETSWLLVGDVGLKKFIAQQVDRLDDIISFEVEIGALSKEEFKQLILKRVDFYRTNPKVTLPVDEDVFCYLYQITKGRLRYIFGLLRRLINSLGVGDLTDRVTIDIAKPMIVQLASERIARSNLSRGEVTILKLLVQLQTSAVSNLAKKSNKPINYISNILSKLTQEKLVVVQKQGRNRYYTPTLDAVIAYS